jgi:hypothetical protein
LVISGDYGESIIDFCEQIWSNWSPKSRLFLDSIIDRSIEPIEKPVIYYKQRGSLLTEVALGFGIDKDPINYFLDPENNNEFLPDQVLATYSQPYLRQLCIIMLLDTMLGAGVSSKLHSKCVLEEGYFDSIFSRLVRYKHGVYLQIFGEVENSQFTFGLESILKVVESLKKSTMSLNDLARIKETLKGRLYKSVDNILLDTKNKLDIFFQTGMEFEIEDYIKTINGIQASEIRNMALDTMCVDNLYLYISGTAKESKIVNRLLDKYLN